MSGFGIDFSCIEDYKKKLEELGRKGARIENKALEESAKPILEEMKKTSSFRDRTGRLRKGLKIDKPKKIKGVKTVKIGITKEDNSEIFYSRFFEYGTSKMTAKPFMRPALDKKRREAVEKMKEIIRRELGI